MSESNLGLNLQQLQVEQYAGTRYVREMNSKTSSKAGGTADSKEDIRPGRDINSIPPWDGFFRVGNEDCVLPEAGKGCLHTFFCFWKNIGRSPRLNGEAVRLRRPE